MPAPDADLLRCYLEELAYLRNMGERFASRYPKVARRLELQADECPDPHVERLIESFAFLTARIQSDLDDDFPEIARALLDVLYPHYLQPTPSMTVVRFDAKPKNTAGAQIARGTPLFVTTAEGDVCRFRTSYPLTIWPISVIDAKFVEGTDYRFPNTLRRPGSVLRLTLQSQGEPFEVLGVDKLRFYLRGEMVVDRLYSMLFEGREEKAVVVPRGATDVPAPPYLRVTPVGFGDDEAVIHENLDHDRTHRAGSLTHPPVAPHSAYRLLQEYFAFEEKFHFVDVHGLQHAKGTEIDLLFLLEGERGRMHLTPESFVLGCTPAVNLFKKTSEPIRIDQRRHEYRIVADHRRTSARIHSIRSMSGSSDAGVKSRQYAPYYSYTHAMAQEKQSAYWHSRRDESGEMYVSFYDAAFDASLPADEVVFAHLWCTNGTLAAELNANYPMQTDEVLPVTQIVNLRKPTLPVDAPSRGETLWRLISQLSLSYLSLGGDDHEKGAASLREMLLLYCGDQSRAHRQRIHAIEAVSSEKIVRRVPGTSANGFARGTRVTVEFSDELFSSDASRLFATVLSHFFGLHASINSFTQLQVRRKGTDRAREEKGHQWPLMPGSRPVL